MKGGEGEISVVTKTFKRLSHMGNGNIEDCMRREDTLCIRVMLEFRRRHWFSILS